jgi:hypothetical protein
MGCWRRDLGFYIGTYATLMSRVTEPSFGVVISTLVEQSSKHPSTANEEVESTHHDSTIARRDY